MYQWSRVWGGTDDDVVYGMTTWQDQIYVTGYFSDVVDFNPSDTGALNRASAGSHDGFVSAFKSNGDFFWVDTWGSDQIDEGHAVATNSYGFAMVTGFFESNCDFDSSSGQDIHTTSLWCPASFISEYSSIGFWHWTKDWGQGDGSTMAKANAIAIDSSDRMFIAGSFTGSADFNPDTPVEKMTSNGSNDVFLLVTTDAGSKTMVQTWGGPDDDLGYGIACDSQSKIYVSGVYQNTVDFNPSPSAEANHTSNGGYDAFMCLYDWSGNYLDTLTWGGPETDRAMGIAVAPGIRFYIAGDYMGTVDLDPGVGSDMHTSNGFSDLYISLIDFNGGCLWTRTFGSTDWDAGLGVAVDPLNSAIFIGNFRLTANFDPSGGTDEHTSNGILDIFVDKILYDGTW